MTLVHADASPQYETLLANQSSFALLDGAGTILAQTAALGTRLAESECTTANIDGQPGDEAVCLLDSSSAPATNQRRITVLHYDAAAQPPSLDVLWSKVVAPDAGGDLRWVNPLGDLDGDGVFEIVATTLDPTLGLQTHVYDAATGTELVTAIPGQSIEGTAALESTTTGIFLTSSGSTVTGWRFVALAHAVGHVRVGRNRTSMCSDTRRRRRSRCRVSARRSSPWTSTATASPTPIPS